MKNLKLVIIITLIISCLIISVLTIIIGSVGTFGMLHDNESLQDMYYLQLVPATELGIAIEMFQRQRVIMREFIIGAAVDDNNLIEDVWKSADYYHEIMQEALGNYEMAIRWDEEMRLFRNAHQLYENEFRFALTLIYESAKRGDDIHELYSIMREYTPIVNEIKYIFDECLEMTKEKAEHTMYISENTGNTLTIIIIFVMILILIINIGVTIFLSLYTSFTVKKADKIVIKSPKQNAPIY